MGLRNLSLAALLTTLVAACAGDPELGPGSPFAIAVVDLALGAGSGYGTPDMALGAPRGGGTHMGSLDALSLGREGQIVLELGEAVVDGPGPDLIVFENPFVFGATGVFVEPGIVAVSEDGTIFHEWPCQMNAPEYEGCAGVHPVLANADENELDPTDPSAAGGDAFDLAELGVPRARFVRIVDAGLASGFGTDNVGFDLDAIAVVHGEHDE
jgi:hypothetical protein